MSSCFYIREDDLYHPQTPATGSWNRGHQNGLATGGLLTDLIESLSVPSPFRIVQLAIDILKPVPFCPIAGRAKIEREDDRRQIVVSEILADGQCVARARAIRIRSAEPDAETYVAVRALAPVTGALPPITRALGPGAPVETQVIRGSRRERGPGAYWTRFNADLVRDRQMSSMVAAVMAADLGSGPSNVLDFEHWTYANIDSVLYLKRPPRGEWLLTEAETTTAGNGSALTSSRLSDLHGPFGFAQQTLFVSPKASNRD